MAAALKRSPKPQLSSLPKLMSKPSTSSSSPKPSSNPITVAKTAIRSESDPDRLVSLFQSSVSSPKFYGDRLIYKIAIQKLARSNRHDLIERILEPQKSDPTLPKSEGFLVRIITLYSDAGMVDHAVRTFDSVPEAGLKHTERTLCALLTVFLKNKLFDRLVESFNQVPEAIGVPPGVTAHNILLQGLSGKGEVEAARKVLDEMPKKGIKPDVVSYNAVLNGYLKKGDMEGFDEIVKEMNVEGLEPNVATFGCRIAGLCKMGKSFEAEELLDVMGKKNLWPNRTMFNIIISGFCKEGNLKKAMMVFERMKSAKKGDSEEAVSPNFETYDELFRSLVESSEFGKGLEVFKECVGREWAPRVGAVSAMVEGLKKENRVDDAKDVLEMMNKVVKDDAIEAWKNVASAISV